MCIRDRYQRRVHGVKEGEEYNLGLSFNAVRRAGDIIGLYEIMMGFKGHLTDCIASSFIVYLQIPAEFFRKLLDLSLIHISEPTRPLYISYAVFCLKKKNYSETPCESYLL
eukprot:TRINITY_DN64880_c0_g1_i2.p2 TRINITY_DN64880_c0_g1~~TRINITY_DN64880_c0_g1_i2.p2  ORF type:complete len:111 (-),score=32.65 TRINITY_DN64880_c0_g1_i2:37-369(-)